MSLSNFSGLLISLSITLYIICIFSFPNVDASLQQITFFENFNCTGEKKVTFTNTKVDLNTTWVANASSVHILGAWRYAAETILATDVPYVRENMEYNSKPPQGFCENKTKDEWGLPNAEKYQFIYADRKGPADMTTSQLIFYTESFFRGLEYVIDQTEMERLPAGGPLAMRSYMLFSNDAWMVYPEANFMGEPVTLSPYDKNAPKDYFQLHGFEKTTVGSVKKVIREVENEKAAGSYKSINGMLLYLMFLAIVKFFN